ncbi:AAA family ATPase [Methylovulum miyakonense]|uniref:AAA family ATPase n=1 Tax=Methylovulum miyakonense TaxID=645578 RepID=UPI0003744581|nr:AAA family ATPase [Methylovulum miyakonense]
MKILSLYFRNINSLVGDSRISFTQGAFANAGVFAITGANGSGKSSILDAITLALYGETSRFDQPAASVISQHTSEAYAEVEFKLGDEKYQSIWQAQRGTDAEDVQAIDMKLTRLSDGQVLAGTPAEVCRAITELTGMNFRNFTRSMLLAQGDFAAFLNALDNERMGILETLIGTDIYTDYRNEILGNAEKAQQSIDAIKQELAGLKLLPAEAVEASEQDLQDYLEQIQELKAAQKHLEQQQAALKNTAHLQAQVVDQKKRLKDLQAQLHTNGQSLENIATAKQALAYQDDLAALDDKQQSLQQHQAAWNTLQNELQFLREQLGDKPEMPAQASKRPFPEQLKEIDRIKFEINQTRLEQQETRALSQTLETQLAEKKAALTTAAAWLDDHANDASLLESFPETARLKKLRAELKELGDKHKQFSNETKKSASSLKNTGTALSKTITEIAELKQELIDEGQAREALLQGHQADAIESLKNEQQGRVGQFQQLLDLALNYQKLSQPSGGILGIFGRKPVVVEDADELALQLEQLRDTIKREENIKLALDAALNREALLKKLLPERAHLVDGKPCPLCGAKEHPYLKHPPVIGNSVQALTDQQMKLRSLSAQTDQLNKRIAIAQKNAEKNRALQAQLENIKASWLSLCNRLNKASADLDIDDLPAMGHWLKNEQEELKNIIALADQYQKKTANIAKINGLIAKNEAAVVQLQENAAQLDNNGQGLSQEYLEIDAALSQCHQDEQALAEKVQAQLAALGETMPGKGKEDAFFDRLNARRQDYQSYAVRHKSLLDDIAAQESQYATCQTEASRCEAKITRLIGQLQGEEQIGVHLALIEKQRLIADKEQLLAGQENQLAALQQGLQAKLKTSPFASLGELRNALQFLAREPEFTRHQAELQAQIAAKTQQLEQLSAELDNDFMIAETAPNPDDIYRQLTGLVGKMDMAQLEIQRLQKRLAQQNQQQERYDELTAALRQREQAAQPALAERSLLDNEHGMAFRRRVQIRVADKLLAHTNRILEKISGRYYLRYNPEHAGLALEIEDTFQGNARRQPKTLSGGESFVVSLALALSLSELANNNKSVDSLFIDEGFGNLDGDSLTLVLSTLENLRAYGKTVGVISHVDAVKKRIKAQVQMVKRPNGLGMLKKAS